MGPITQATQKALSSLIKGYRYLISPYLGNRCRFYPSCSDYAQQALLERSLPKAMWLILYRLLRCHPFCPGGYDPL